MTPLEKRTLRALRLCDGIRDLALSHADDCAIHAAFTLLQRTVCPALDFDLRACSLSQVRPSAERLQVGISDVVGALLEVKASLRKLLFEGSILKYSLFSNYIFCQFD